MMEEQETRQIFVGGSGRSGTTMLGRIFGGHPHVLYFQEPGFLSHSGGLFDLARGKVNYSDFKKNMLSTFRAKLPYKYRSDPQKKGLPVYTEEAVEKILRSAFESQADQLESYRKFVSDLFDLGVRARGKKYWVEKTPHTIMMAPFLYMLFPEMKYIHILREPKDTYCSLLKQPWGPKQVDDFVRWYCYIMNVAYVAQRKIPPANYYVISVENLITNLHEAIRDILAFVSIESSAEIIDMCASKVHPEELHIKRWLEMLSGDEAALIDKNCGELYGLWKQREAKSNVCEVQIQSLSAEPKCLDLLKH